MADSFDIVIVGGGSAGCVLANRLSARSSQSVALIEAGVDTPPDHTDQVLWDSYPIIAYFDRRHQWTDLRVRTRPDGPLRTYEQARVMGGGSSINGQMANRGQPFDYDEWAEEGAAGWTWQSVAPYFRKLERDLDFAGEHHGTDGPVADPPGAQDRLAGLLRARRPTRWSDSGLPWIEDQNTSEFAPACFPITINNEADHRVSSAVAYLSSDVRNAPEPDDHGPNARDPTADGRHRAAPASRSTGRTDGARSRLGRSFCAAGAIHSPAMLMRAGIGAGASTCERSGSGRRRSAGVGQNLMDHPMISVSAFLKRAARLAKAQRRHIFLGHALVVRGGRLPAGRYVRRRLQPGRLASGRLADRRFSDLDQQVVLARIRCDWPMPSPDREPEVQFNLLGDQRDLDRMRDAVRYMIRLFDHPAVRRSPAIRSRPATPSDTSDWRRSIGATR